jgi:hypothetical protein
VTSPSNEIATPGYYMLFVLEERTPGQRLVPSIAEFVRFDL